MDQKTMTLTECRQSVKRAKKVMIITSTFSIDESGQPKRRMIKISKRAAIKMLSAVTKKSVIVAQWADDDWRQFLMIGQ